MKETWQKGWRRDRVGTQSFDSNVTRKLWLSTCHLMNMLHCMSGTRSVNELWICLTGFGVLLVEDLHLLPHGSHYLNSGCISLCNDEGLFCLTNFLLTTHVYCSTGILCPVGALQFFFWKNYLPIWAFSTSFCGSLGAWLWIWSRFYLWLLFEAVPSSHEMGR